MEIVVKFNSYRQVLGYSGDILVSTEVQLINYWHLLYMDIWQLCLSKMYWKNSMWICTKMVLHNLHFGFILEITSETT